MCVTKKKQQKQAMRSVRAFGPVDSTTAPAATPEITPATRSADQSKEKSKIKKVTVKEKSKKGNVQSDYEKRSIEDQNKPSGLSRILEAATCKGQGPPVMPPVKLDAKRDVRGVERDPKDPDYVTLNDVGPPFGTAKLKGYRTSKEQQTIRIEPTQPSSNNKEEEQKKKKKEIKKSGEKSSKE